MGNDDGGVTIDFGTDKKKKKARGPPRNIVKSGNAGSSKGSTTSKNAGGSGKDLAPPAPSASALLFPGWTGKNPVTLLNEHCQRAGWERPSIDVKKISKDLFKRLEGEGDTNMAGYTATITVRRKPHKKSTRDGDEVAVLRPHPPTLVNRESINEAKHWGATFGLFSVANHLSLSFALPPPCRDFWCDLQALKKKSLPADAWRWNPDPFVAAKSREESKEIMADKRQSRTRREALATGQGTVSDEEAESKRQADEEEKERKAGKLKGGYWSQFPTVHMSMQLRELVEHTVKDGYTRFPESNGAPHEEDSPQAHSARIDELALALADLSIRDGFRKGHVESAMEEYLVSKKPVDDLVMAKDWCTQWLLTYLPEDDLPPRYHHSSRKGLGVEQNIRLGGAGKGQEGLQQEWLVEKVGKVTGISTGIIQSESIKHKLRDEALLIDHLLQLLTGWHWPQVETTKISKVVEEELMTLEAIQGDRFRRLSSEHVVIDVRTERVQLEIHYYPHCRSKYLQSQSPPTISIASSGNSTLPAYIRLHLTKTLILQCRDDPEWSETIESGEMGGGIISSMIDWLEINVDGILDRPPNISQVMSGLVPKTSIEGSIKGVANDNVTGVKDEGRLKVTMDKSGRQDRAITDRLRAQRDRMLSDPKHQAMLNQREKLPAAKLKRQFLDLVENNQVVVVMGSTGCGKTTQLPQFLLDDQFDRSDQVSILVTQPRRVSAIGVAERVALERMETIGKSECSVGYTIRGERKASRQTRLMFCTTGIALRRLAVGDGLEGVTHVVVDEVHERSIDGDTLLLELKELIRKRSDLKIILMSATIDEELFSQYFGEAPTLQIPGFTFDVTEHYLEDIVETSGFRPAPSGAVRSSEKNLAKERRAEYRAQGLSSSLVESLELISSATFFDYNLILSVVKHIQTLEEGAILIFLSGVQEIKTCCRLLESQCTSVKVLPLHANLPTSEQSLVFRPVKPGLRKIVVATNVAETSITIEDVVFVIDSGKVKETRFEAQSGLTKLVETWVSHAAARQRKGRAGRVRPGHCFKLFSRAVEKLEMDPYQTPEILRTPLEQLLLQVKAMRESEDAAAFLSKAITPPDTQSIGKAKIILQDLGAVDNNDHLTAMGRYMSMIPVDLRLAKMMILASIFDCLEPILTCSAILSSKPLFQNPIEHREESKEARAKFQWAVSDLLTDVNAYTQWATMIEKGELISQSQKTRYCQDNFLSMSAIRDVTSLREDFRTVLAEIGMNLTNATATPKSNDANLLKTIIYAGLFPNLARVQTPTAKYDKVMTGTIQRDIEARQVKFFTKEDGRVFILPSSILFANHKFKSPFVTFFAKSAVVAGKGGNGSADSGPGPKVYLRDATEIPMYALLFFGKTLVIDHENHGLVIDDWIKLRAWTRIGVLVNHLKRLLYSLLDRKIAEPALDISKDPIVDAMRALLDRDGL